MSFILTLMIIFTLNLTFYLQSYGQEFLNPGFEESFSSEACDDCDEGLGCIVGWWNYLPHNSNFTGYRFVYDYDCTGNRSGVCQGDYGLKFYRNTLDIHQPIQFGSAVATRNPFYGTEIKEEEYVIKFNGFYKQIHINAVPLFLQISGSETAFEDLNPTSWIGESTKKITSTFCNNYEMFLGRNGKDHLYEESLDEFKYLVFMYNSGSSPAIEEIVERTDPASSSDNLTVIDELSICKPVNISVDYNCANNIVCFRFDFDESCHLFPSGKADGGEYNNKMILYVDGNKQFEKNIYEDTEFCLDDLEAGTHTYEYFLESYFNASEYWTLQGPADPDDFVNDPFAGTFNVVGGASADIIISSNTTWDAMSVPNGGVVKNVTVEDGATLTIESGTVVKFCPGARLLVEAGAKLELDGKLTSLTDEGWKGIEVDGLPNSVQNPTTHGVVDASITSIIENAGVGIYAGATAARAGGIINCYGSTFHNNRIGVVVANYKAFNDISSFELCNFETDGDYKLSENMVYDVRLVYGRGVSFENCSFENSVLLKSNKTVNGSTNYGAGIFSIASGMEVKGCSFTGLNYGVYFGINGSKTYNASIIGSTFTSCLNGIVNLGRASVFINDNRFEMDDDIPTQSPAPQVGIYLYSSILGQTIEQNAFVRSNEYSRYSIGVLAGYTGSYYNRINENTFTGLDMGTETYGKNGELIEKYVSGLTYTCNEFADITDYDFYIKYPNNGLYGMNPIQSNPGLLVTTPYHYGAQNIFSYSGFDMNRHDFDNKNVDKPIKYYFKTESGTRYEPYFFTPVGVEKIEINQTKACPTSSFFNKSYSELSNEINTAKYELDLIGIALESETDSLIIDSLQKNAAYYSFVLQTSGADLIEVLDSNQAPLDTIIHWLDRIDLLGADLMIAERLADAGLITDAKDKLDDILIGYDLTTEEEDDILELKDIYDLPKYNNPDSISSININGLRSLIFHGPLTSGVARTILGIKGEFYDLPYFFVGDTILPRKSKVENNYKDIKLYPNPTSGVVTLIVEKENEHSTIWIYDMFGNQLLRQKLNIGKNLINIDKSNTGIVIYNIFNEQGKMIKSGKLITIK